MQLYEVTLKSVLENSDLITTPAEDGGFSSVSSINAESMTLGGLVSQMLGTVLIPSGNAPPMDDTVEQTGAAPSARIRFRIEFPADGRLQIEKGLRKLVTMRNALVHHFILQHDLSSAEGCRSAIKALALDLARIRDHLGEVKAWVQDLENLKLQMAAALGTDEIMKSLTGEKTSWRHTTIVHGLQAAERALGQDGWTSLAAAQIWMSEHYPDEIPSHYDCRSWAQLLHDARLFDLRRPERQRYSTLYRTRPVLAERSPGQAGVTR